MSRLIIPRFSEWIVGAALTLAAAAACGPGTNTAGSQSQGSADTTGPPVVSVGSAPAPSAAQPRATSSSSGSSGGSSSGSSSGSSGSSAASWPSPEDCVSYNPNHVTVAYEAGVYGVVDGATVVLRLNGQPGDDTGQKGLALAQRYHRHCYIGRTNNRVDQASYVFDYWRDPSSLTPTIPGQEDDCSGYNRNNLTVEDMGGGDGWRVKDHDHVLQLFDNGTDARNGKLVLSKYNTICFIGDPGDNGQDQVSYML
jgi:hypothetical protein